MVSNHLIDIQTNACSISQSADWSKKTVSFIDFSSAAANTWELLLTVGSFLHICSSLHRGIPTQFMEYTSTSMAKPSNEDSRMTAPLKQIHCSKCHVCQH